MDVVINREKCPRIGFMGTRRGKPINTATGARLTLIRLNAAVLILCGRINAHGAIFTHRPIRK